MRSSPWRASRLSGFSLRTLVYSTMARSYSWRNSACRPSRRALAVAHPVSASVRTRMASRLPYAIGDGVDSPRNPEHEFLIGRVAVFLHTRKRQRRFPSLAIPRGERTDLQSRLVDRHDQVLVLLFGPARYQLQEDAAR